MHENAHKYTHPWPLVAPRINTEPFIADYEYVFSVVYRIGIVLRNLAIVIFNIQLNLPNLPLDQFICIRLIFQKNCHLFLTNFLSERFLFALIQFGFFTSRYSMQINAFLLFNRTIE